MRWLFGNSSVRNKTIEILALLFLITFVGTLGFHLLEGWSLFDSFYMTIITITTTGFEEVHPLSFSGRILAIVVMVSGISAFFYAIGQLFPLLVEKRIMRRKRLPKDIQDHIIVCGYGTIGTNVLKEISSRKDDKKIVVIDKDQDKVSMAREDGYWAVHGDVTDEEVLEKADVKTAGFLITCVDDSDNAFCIMIAKEFNEEIYSIAIARSTSNLKNLERAGADQVLSPYQDTASKVKVLIKNPVSSNIAEVISGLGGNNYFEKIDIGEKGEGETIRSLSLQERTNALVIAVGKGKRIARPTPDMELEKGDKLYVIGSEKEVEKAIDLLSK
ncbi:MAG: Kef-type K+ transport system, putative NAD-binding component [Candidatus Methanohalarchaeum thermophilum]|uniref:Kef-type K+ transport system, putative NAD-binding component n=1 Tax=Methanohalarchaeum thermophilum TaxID=1903181 RepID=A0A1Q6DXN1_METT1|nr:MAG: Kef-type K+ transport system, putative NAD-binding component [Candidatus Methanohalarchaeum thermophilum]